MVWNIFGIINWYYKFLFSNDMFEQLKSTIPGAGEKAEWLSMLAAFVKDQRLGCQYSHSGSQTIWNSSSWESSALFWRLEKPFKHMVHKLTCRENTHSQENKQMSILKTWTYVTGCGGACV